MVMRKTGIFQESWRPRSRVFVHVPQLLGLSYSAYLLFCPLPTCSYSVRATGPPLAKLQADCLQQAGTEGPAATRHKSLGRKGCRNHDFSLTYQRGRQP